MEAYKAEYEQLRLFEQLLGADRFVPVRISHVPRDLSRRHLEVRIEGVETLIANPTTSTDSLRASANVDVRVPPGYPEREIPEIRFLHPVPFHPHVFPDGRVDWGTAWRPRPQVWLVDWILSMIDLMQYGQGDGNQYSINQDSPANAEAMAWYRRHKEQIASYVPLVPHRERLRQLAERARGIIRA